MQEPSSVRWTDHALAKAEQLGFARADVERAVLEGHGKRRRNSGRAEWQVTADRLVVVYDHPDHDNATTARVVTVWRRR